jgi:hypothetical protein
MLRKLLLGVVIEVLLATMLAGMILALAIPLLNRGGLIHIGDARSRGIIIGVMLAALAIALLRPGSAIHRYVKR